ncbi:hypothetical protein DSECCO2_465120 [anaerobic digester metagenome]
MIQVAVRDAPNNTRRPSPENKDYQRSKVVEEPDDVGAVDAAVPVDVLPGIGVVHRPETLAPAPSGPARPSLCPASSGAGASLYNRKY